MKLTAVLIKYPNNKCLLQCLEYDICTWAGIGIIFEKSTKILSTEIKFQHLDEIKPVKEVICKDFNKTFQQMFDESDMQTTIVTSNFVLVTREYKVW